MTKIPEIIGVVIAGFILATTATAQRASNAAGTYALRICSTSCAGKDSSQTLNTGFLVLSDRPIDLQHIPVAARNHIQRVSEDLTQGERGNACFALGKQRPVRVMAGIIPYAVTRWTVRRDTIEVLLYGSPDASSSFRATLEGGKLTGVGREAGFIGTSFDDPGGVIQGIRIGPPDVSTCFSDSLIAENKILDAQPFATTKARLEPIVKGILAAWDKYDVVCLGEGHGNKNDSDLRISLVENPAFARKVKTIIVEWADVRQQALLDRFILDNDNLPREKLRDAWKEMSSRELWDLPMYEAFLRSVQKVNAALPRSERIRVIGGDNPGEQNRGKFIRDAVSQEILNKGAKALAIYGSAHCENRGMGFPGELAGAYPGKIWSAAAFHFPDEGRRVFKLSDAPALIQITGTDKENLPSRGLFAARNDNDNATLHYRFNAIIYYGNLKSVKD